MLERCYDVAHAGQQQESQAMDGMLICWLATDQKARDEMM
jgi:hypothetical protein